MNADLAEGNPDTDPDTDPEICGSRGCPLSRFGLPHGDLDPVTAREFLGLVIPSVHVAQMPIPGSLVSTRSIRLAISFVPSATVTCPA